MNSHFFEEGGKADECTNNKHMCCIFLYVLLSAKTIHIIFINLITSIAYNFLIPLHVMFSFEDADMIIAMLPKTSSFNVTSYK